MNLVDQPWIPVIFPDGRTTSVSLMDLFQQAGEIRDLAVNPVQRIALMRLLICITQTTLDGPEDEEDWYRCRGKITAAATDYLAKWHHAFELRGKSAFLQIPELECREKGDKSLLALDCRSPYGGSSTMLFARDLAHKDSNSNDAQTALSLLTLLNFSTGGKVGQSVWNGIQYSDATFAAPCIKAAHTFIRSDTLLGTLYFNLLTKHGQSNGVSKLPNCRWGRPVWEHFPKDVGDSQAFDNASESYLGRLVPLSRFVRIGVGNNERCIIGPSHKSFKIEGLPLHREPSLTVMQNKKGEPYSLPLNASKHIWRELGSVLALRDTPAGQQAALSLRVVRQFPDLFPEEQVDVWVGGLEVGATAAKLSDMVEWVVNLPIGLFQESSLLQYEAGVALADRGSAKLKLAVLEYWSFFKKDPRKISYDKAFACYWHCLDSNCTELISTANSSNHESLDSAWHPIVCSAMETAYDRDCPHISPRQIQAFVKGRNKLKLGKLNDASAN